MIKTVSYTSLSLEAVCFALKIGYCQVTSKLFKKILRGFVHYFHTAVPHKRLHTEEGYVITDSLCDFISFHGSFGWHSTGLHVFKFVFSKHGIKLHCVFAALTILPWSNHNFPVLSIFLSHNNATCQSHQYDTNKVQQGSHDWSC